jgi:hypothetical protein
MESETGENSHRNPANGYDEVIVFDMKQVEQR